MANTIVTWLFYRLEEPSWSTWSRELALTPLAITLLWRVSNTWIVKNFLTIVPVQDVA